MFVFCTKSNPSFLGDAFLNKDIKATNLKEQLHETLTLIACQKLHKVRNIIESVQQKPRRITDRSDCLQVAIINAHILLLITFLFESQKSLLRTA
jgi:hypothetical protein